MIAVMNYRFRIPKKLNRIERFGSEHCSPFKIIDEAQTLFVVISETHCDNSTCSTVDVGSFSTSAQIIFSSWTEPNCLCRALLCTKRPRAIRGK